MTVTRTVVVNGSAFSSQTRSSSSSLETTAPRAASSTSSTPNSLRVSSTGRPARRTVSRAGRSLDLTRKEFGVLEVLLAARGAVVSSEELLERVWDENADPFTTTVRVTVMTLRKKLGDPPLIETVVGAGYRTAEASA